MFQVIKEAQKVAGPPEAVAIKDGQAGVETRAVGQIKEAEEEEEAVGQKEAEVRNSKVLS
jgi:hypothetical protein